MKMTAGKIHASQIDDYVAECDARFGGIQTPEWLAFVSDFELVCDTKVDLTLDPFSDDYFQQQLALHGELTGRDFNQELNELVPINISANAAGQNPYNSTNIALISHHAATLAIALRLAAPPSGAKILDLGVGTGMSSELMAYCGATVTAVDISPSFIDLIRTRADKSGLPITAKLSSFDAYDDVPETYDMAMFFASLHHGTRPWDILRKIARLVKPGGKIVLAAEPIQKLWWPYWGLRLDAESVYVARKYGWFESGWSELFLRKMFHDIGFKLDVSYIDPNLIEGAAIAVGYKSNDIPPVFSIDLPVIPRRSKLQFGASAKGLQYLTHGWSAASDIWGTWSSGSNSGFLLALPPGDAWTFNVEVHPMVGPDHPKQDVEIVANGVPIKSVSIAGNNRSFTMQETSIFQFDFTRQQISLRHSCRTVEMIFRYPDATKAQNIGRGSDPRLLAIGLVSLEIV
ncbi:class I SAM-dependent methyltransferase [Bradyrhizobium prioriisuperbiae]|uniref:class I SAM-dependent methyltransferase n=1 Tax=Bradyrhizobium prioriisuperbiae TaxID=2854389 RepID=UPI0028E18ED7|nr:class I SAM-dependent methyltransferase [Bradyrhizobium prioritasuperba]